MDGDLDSRSCGESAAVLHDSVKGLTWGRICRDLTSGRPGQTIHRSRRETLFRRHAPRRRRWCDSVVMSQVGDRDQRCRNSDVKVLADPAASSPTDRESPPVASRRSREELIARRRFLPRVDAGSMRRDLDALMDRGS